ncbi:serine protease [Uliginosibacterium sp. sgz301328]|uniref:S1 family peptidase n=1 Tax=Uliginosibacterium sp. sgz301328 TaxID=3243764 RepID=UPI00359DC144
MTAIVHLARRRMLLAALSLPLLCGAAVAADLPTSVARMRASIVAVGTVQPGRNPQFRVLGTGFAVGDGTLVATNFHVVPELLDTNRLETLAIAIPVAGATVAAVREVSKVSSDPAHDLVLLKLAGGAPLPALKIGDSAAVHEGDAIAFTGFPMGDVLGLFPVTHRGIVSAVAPIGIPVTRARDLDARTVRQLSAGPFDIFQLDATAYPGHSGSPMFEPETGEVVGILNMVFIKGTRESALSQPSGISYAVPAKYLQDLIKAARTSSP